ncbi:hypothetical protein BKA93DRAFT_561826 [Sparassis latifolia]
MAGRHWRERKVRLAAGVGRLRASGDVMTRCAREIESLALRKRTRVVTSSSAALTLGCCIILWRDARRNGVSKACAVTRAREFPERWPGRGERSHTCFIANLRISQGPHTGITKIDWWQGFGMGRRWKRWRTISSGVGCVVLSSPSSIPRHVSIARTYSTSELASTY